MAWMLCVLVLVSGCSALTGKKPAPLSPAQKMVTIAKPAVVRPVSSVSVTFTFKDPVVAAVVGANPYVMTVGATGSGWFISPDGYIVTNAHVVEIARLKDAELLEKVLFPRLIRLIEEKVGKLPPSDILQVANTTYFEKIERKLFVLTPGGEQLTAEIKAYGVPIGDDVSGKDVAVLKVEGKYFPTLTPADSETVKVQDKIYSMGYPGAADFFGLFDDKSILEASVSDGTVQARKNTAQGTPVIQAGGSANPGNSGGPVLNEKGEVVGIVTFGKTEGVYFVVPMNTIGEFVRQSGATVSPGLTTTKFQEAMDLYWNGKYRKAIERYEEILRLYPAHSEAKRLLREAEERKKDEPRISPVLLGGIGGVLLLLIILLVLLGARRRPAGP